MIHTSIHSGISNAVLGGLSRRADLSMDFSNDGFTHTNVAELAPILRFAFFSAGERSLEEVHTFAKYAADCGIPQVIFTMGTRGACGISQGQFWQADACVIQPVDALGAGDAFIAAFLYTFWENGGSALLAAEQAAHFAADCCLHYGAFGHPLSLAESDLLSTGPQN